MADLLYAVERIVPVFLIVLVGVFLRHSGLVKAEQTPALSNVVFYILLPCMLFGNMISADWAMIQDWSVYWLIAAGYVVTALLVTLIVSVFIKDKKVAGAVAHSTFRPNSLLVGYPVAINIFGAAKALPILILSILLSPITNVLAVIILAHMGKSAERVSFWTVLKGILSNVLLLSLLAGFLFMKLGWRLPGILSNVLSAFAGAVPAITMLSIGTTLDFKHFTGNLRHIAASSVVKLLVIPAVFSTAAILLGLRGSMLVSLFLVMGSPAASVSGVISGKMGCDGQISNEIIIATTVLSSLTLIAGVFLFKHFGYIPG